MFLNISSTKVFPTLLLLLAVALANNNGASARLESQIRAQLEQELGLSLGPMLGRKQPEPAKQPAQQSAPTDGAQISEELKAKVLELQKSIVESVKRSDSEAALKGMKEFIGLLEPILKTTRDMSVINMGIQAYNERINYLKSLQRPVEAAVEANKFENICPAIYGCNTQAARSLAFTLDLDLKLVDKFGLLQIPPGASRAQIKKSYMKLTLLLHPDKNRSLDESVIKFRESLLGRVTDAYKELTS